MAGEIVKYIPLDSIVKSKPEERSLDSRELYSREEDTGYESVMGDLEKRLFEERQSGKFLIFHRSVLGMALVYKVPESSFYVAFEPIINNTTLTIPDAAIMKQLQFTLPPEQYEKLEQFYSFMRSSAGTGNYHGLNFLHTMLHHEGPTVFNSFQDTLDIYHNGVRVRQRESVELKSGDVIRIGPSILFGYFEKR